MEISSFLWLRTILSQALFLTLNNGSGVNFVYLTVWQKIDSKTYYFETDEAMKKGLLTLSDKQYYLNEKDGVLTPNIVLIDGKKIFIDNEGNRSIGWKKIDGKWYYFSKEDGMKTGWYQVGSKWYYSYPSGVLAVNTTIDGYTVNANGEWV